MSPETTALALPAPCAPTEPRTLAGKQRSSRNSTKHGIFSRAILLHNESPAKYKSLLAALRDSFQPESAIEHLLVQKLATLLWRHRRLLVAERAEIDTAVDSLTSPQDPQPADEGEDFERALTDRNYGLMRRTQDPGVLPSCLTLLGELRDAVAGAGFDKPRDSAILGKLYGLGRTYWKHQTLADSYQDWQATAEAGEEERRRQEYDSPDECIKKFLGEIDREISSLKRAQKQQLACALVRRKLETLRRNVPHAPELDRLLRYEAALERAFDRALSQLERLQRIRKGQPLPPEIKLSLAR